VLATQGHADAVEIGIEPEPPELEKFPTLDPILKTQPAGTSGNGRVSSSAPFQYIWADQIPVISSLAGSVDPFASATQKHHCPGEASGLNVNGDSSIPFGSSHCTSRTSPVAALVTIRFSQISLSLTLKL
jgi:hypothetical protein